MPQQNDFLIIAVYLFEPSKSKILMENIPEDTREIPIDLSAFLGRGVSVCVCLPVDGSEDDGEAYIDLDYRGGRQTFHCLRSIEDFPLIEGEVDPGIYSLEEGDSRYYEIYDFEDVTLAFDQLPEGSIIERFKFVCASGKIIWKWLDENGSYVEFERHSFSFFDLICPFCGTKISGYETEGENPHCRPVEQDCPHYAGPVTCDRETGRQRVDLEELKFGHKFVGDELLLENPKGEWKKPVAVNRDHEDDYAYRPSEEEGSIDFLFVD